MALNSSFYSNCWKVFTQIRWNSLATCFRIFSGTIYNVPVLFSWFPGLVYIVFASDTQNMTRPFRNRGKRYLPVYICVSTFDRTGLFETLCLFSSSFSKNFECYYWTLPPALSSKEALGTKVRQEHDPSLPGLKISRFLQSYRILSLTEHYPLDRKVPSG